MKHWTLERVKILFSGDHMYIIEPTIRSWSCKRKRSAENKNWNVDDKHHFDGQW